MIYILDRASGPSGSLLLPRPLSPRQLPDPAHPPNIFLLTVDRVQPTRRIHLPLLALPLWPGAIWRPMGSKIRRSRKFVSIIACLIPWKSEYSPERHESFEISARGRWLHPLPMRPALAPIRFASRMRFPCTAIEFVRFFIFGTLVSIPVLSRRLPISTLPADHDLL